MIVTATKEVQDALGGRGFPRLTSPSLRLEKFVRISEKRDNENLKRDEITDVVKCHNTKRDAFPGAFSPADLPDAVTLHMKLAYRLIVNQAGGVLENAGLCLHRHFGFPYIPGSAVKGAARHAAWCRWDDEGEAGQALKIALTFGYPTGDRGLDAVLADDFPELFSKETGKYKTFAGTVAFLPAWPADPKSVKLVTDIVNCHHPKYYSRDPQYINTQGGRAADDESPNPQFFPAVEAGATFQFVLLPTRRAKNIANEFHFDPLEFARDALREACEIHGLGAKTAAGYGWFEPDAQAEERAVKEREAREAERKRQEAKARMSPEERKAEEYAETVLGRGDPEGVLKGKMRSIADLPREEQTSICQLLRGRFSELWKADVLEAEKAERQSEKKRAKNKGLKRVTAVRAVAEKLGIELP